MQRERTPLIIASREGHTAVVKLLISRGAHVNDTNEVCKFCHYLLYMFFTHDLMSLLCVW